MCKSDHGTDAACGGLGGYATISSASTHQVHNRRRNGTYNTGMLLSISRPYKLLGFCGGHTIMTQDVLM